MTLLSTTSPAEWTLSFPDRVERHAIDRAVWSTYDTDNQATLTLRVEAGKLLEPLPPREGMPTPFWELTLILPPGEHFDLEPGAVLDIPGGFDADRDEYVVDFYYYEHEVSDSNRIRILAKDGRTLELEVTGIAQEYQTDGSSKPVELNARARFTWDEQATRSSQ